MSGSLEARAEEIFLRAVELDGEARARLLDELASEPDLRQRVERFLAWDDRVPGDFLAGEDDGRGVEPGARIGPYQVVERLGQGGMGTVFAVRQVFPRRDVALKVMRSGRVTDETLRRFRYEIDVLGRLQHVGIARIYDAGVVEAGGWLGFPGQVPYFTMELVRGVPLVAYARERGLDTRARVELLARVADAVHYAHQHGVIHRDLKSENVLVTTEESTTGGSDTGLTGVGQPKILDFGIARAVTPEGLERQTLEGSLLGSLSSMSPEQVAGTNALVDVRSDVYALGVMLYELLAGRPPLQLDGLSVPQAARRISEDEPTPLGDVDSSLRGDLTVVGARALEKDPERRYPSAHDLASDLRHYLHGEPIEARADSRLYVLHRSLRRHRLVISAALLIALLTVVFAVSSGLQARESAALARSESAARRRSESDFQRALAAIDLLTDVAMQDLAEIPRAEDARRKLLEASLAFHEQLIEAHGSTDELHARGVASRNRVARILDDLGRQGEAREALVQSLDELARLPRSREQSLQEGASLGQLANALLEDGELAQAEEHARRAVELLVDEEAPDPESAAVRAQLISHASRTLSNTLEAAGRPVEALDAIELAREFVEQAVALEASAANRAELLRLLHRLTRARIVAGREEGVLELYGEAVALGEALLEEEPDSGLYLSDVVALLTNRGLHLGRVGRVEAMRADLERAVHFGEQLAADHPARVDWLESYAMACNNLATVRSDEERHDEAAELLQRARDVQRDILERAPSIQRAGELGFLENNLGAMLVFGEEYEQAYDVLRSSATNLDRALLALPERVELVAAREMARVHLARAALGMGRHAEALETLAPTAASSEWRIVARVLDAYQETLRLAGQDPHVADRPAGLDAYVAPCVGFLRASLEAGLVAPGELGDAARFGGLLEHATFAETVRGTGG